jgi:glycosyltransferase involved in cell wall biosynthesis
MADLPWSCVCVGTLRREPAYVAGLRRLIGALGLDDRVRLAGPHTGERLAAHFAAADLVVLASRGETYGMVVTEALARGIPVLATAVDALPDTLGRAPDGSVPGLLTPPEDPMALAGALRRWLGEPGLRQRIRASARARRGMLSGWELTSRRLADVLERLRRQPLETT